MESIASGKHHAVHRHYRGVLYVPYGTRFHDTRVSVLSVTPTSKIQLFLHRLFTKLTLAGHLCR